MNEPRFILFDTETGGLDPKSHSLLTAHFKLLNDKFKPLKELSLSTLPFDDTYRVTPFALRVNRIDLANHSVSSIPPEQAGTLLLDFIRKESWLGENKLIPVAHNITFDLNFIYEHLIPKSEWEKYVSYHSIDTASIANFLKMTGILPANQSVSLGKLAAHYGIKTDGAHDAKVDVEIMEKVLLEFQASVSGPKAL